MTDIDVLLARFIEEWNAGRTARSRGLPEPAA